MAACFHGFVLVFSEGSDASRRFEVDCRRYPYDKNIAFHEVQLLPWLKHRSHQRRSAFVLDNLVANPKALCSHLISFGAVEVIDEEALLAVLTKHDRGSDTLLVDDQSN